MPSVILTTKMPTVVPMVATVAAAQNTVVVMVVSILERDQNIGILKNAGGRGRTVRIKLDNVVPLRLKLMTKQLSVILSPLARSVVARVDTAGAAQVTVTARAVLTLRLIRTINIQRNDGGHGRTDRIKAADVVQQLLKSTARWRSVTPPPVRRIAVQLVATVVAQVHTVTVTVALTTRFNLPKTS